MIRIEPGRSSNRSCCRAGDLGVVDRRDLLARLDQKHQNLAIRSFGQEGRCNRTPHSNTSDIINRVLHLDRGVVSAAQDENVLCSTG